jgi:hypothetical protein
MKLLRYEFNLVVASYGESVDEAFSRVLDSLKEDPEAAIINEVVYAVVNAEDPQDETPT